MPPTPPPETITLKIKVPPGHLGTTAQDSFDLGNVSVGATIGSLRKRIQDLVPTNPAPERQRLLYGGRALVDNEQTVADALNTKRDVGQGEYVVHLLVKGEGLNATTGLGSGHVRAASTPPTGPQNGTVLQQQQMPQMNLPPHMHNMLLQQQQQQMRAMHLAHAQGQAQAQQRNGGAGPVFFPPLVAGQGMPPGVQMPQQAQAGQQQQNDVGHVDGQTVRPQDAQPQTNHQQQQGARRPVSGQGFHFEGTTPNGQRIQFHQQTINIPHLNPGQYGHPPQMAMPFAMPGMNIGNPPPGLGQPPGFGQLPRQQPNGPSALDRARENMAEMRRVLDEIRNQPDAPSEEQRRRIEEAQRRAGEVEGYIDPFSLGGAAPASESTAGGDGTGRRSAPPPLPPRAPAPNMFPQGVPRPTQYPAVFPAVFPAMAQQQQQPSATTNPSDVTAYLLSGPQGPHALLFSPQHGTFHGSATGLRPTPTTRTATGQQPLLQPWQRVAQQQPAAPQAQDNNIAAARALPGPPGDAAAAPNPLQPLLAHFWLLLRILIFAYFLLGANMGYTRPITLLGIGLIFWALRMGALGNVAGPVRAWWDGVVAAPQRNQAPQEEREGGAPAAPMPTPQQVAQRLLEDRNRVRRNWWRERVRPVERAVALFVASLWPGVGEAHVRAREEEQRRVQEEEVAAATRVEEEARERVRREGEGKGKAEKGGEKVGEKKKDGEAGQHGAKGGVVEEKADGNVEGSSTRMEQEKAIEGERVTKSS
ncbi:hypothetical protein LTR37_013425 [Vermiconidia calcicola]|uniref:Uncharacterized protein n=1 Tax=Vermiconidia calcicola TaxID=1690605 RepID=A0ACC3MY57_9PEZI|nr:hypothetical protein LTR37_013425 [Vermiconidia calcicola]